MSGCSWPSTMAANQLVQNPPKKTSLPDLLNPNTGLWGLICPTGCWNGGRLSQLPAWSPHSSLLWSDATFCFPDSWFPDWLDREVAPALLLEVCLVVALDWVLSDLVLLDACSASALKRFAKLSLIFSQGVFMLVQVGFSTEPLKFNSSHTDQTLPLKFGVYTWWTRRNENTFGFLTAGSPYCSMYCFLYSSPCFSTMWERRLPLTSNVTSQTAHV